MVALLSSSNVDKIMISNGWGGGDRAWSEWGREHQTPPAPDRSEGWE